MVSTKTSRTAAAMQARRTTAEAMIDRVHDALRHMKREHTDISVAAVARRARVSRTFLYQNATARQLVADFIAEMTDQHARAQSAEDKQIAASWRERALNAEEQLTCLNREIIKQRNTIGELLGKVRDLEADLPEDGVQRLITERTTLKRKINELTLEVTRLRERLQAARDNSRSLDNRIASLEIQLVDRPDQAAGSGSVNLHP
jgi:chromosome segregation ATPase